VTNIGNDDYGCSSMRLSWGLLNEKRMLIESWGADSPATKGSFFTPPHNCKVKASIDFDVAVQMKLINAIDCQRRSNTSQSLCSWSCVFLLC